MSSKEGTTQGDPFVMAVYAIAIILLILMILEITDSHGTEKTRAAAFADELTATSKIAGILVLLWVLMISRTNICLR